MNYIHRHLERKFTKMNEFFKVLLVTGARQVGKTTMLKHLCRNQNRTYISLDNEQACDLARRDPVMFFQAYKPPILIDEIQYAPSLFRQIKILCDESEEPGRFWLTGSQHYGIMSSVSESLAGRIGIMNMFGLSQSEKQQINFPDNLDFSFNSFQERATMAVKANLHNVYQHIWQGTMPQVFNADFEKRFEYYESYLDSYLIRDIIELYSIVEINKFRKFIRACAAIIGQLVNFTTLAEAAEISTPTAKAWIDLLVGLGIVYLLPVYSNNALKRLVKTPKLYFCDPGLAAHLSMWLTPETLTNGSASGRFFENYVVMELVKHYAYAPRPANLFFYRDFDKKEIDLCVETAEHIHPLEIKKSANPNPREIRKFSLLQKPNLQIGYGGIICLCEEPLPIDSANSFIPCVLI